MGVNVGGGWYVSPDYSAGRVTEGTRFREQISNQQYVKEAHSHSKSAPAYSGVWASVLN